MADPDGALTYLYLCYLEPAIPPCRTLRSSRYYFTYKKLSYA